MSQDRITIKDIRQALEHHIDALAKLGIMYGGTHQVCEGSKTYGNAYRIYRTNVMEADGKVSTGHYPPAVGDDYLGMTARDAYETLTNRTRVLWDVARAVKANGGDIANYLGG